MAKGYFTQGAVILMEALPPMESVREALKAFPIEGVRRNPNPDWMSGAETLSIHFRPEANGRILIDGLSSPWPDAMGDPHTDPTLFGAWSMGFLGPHTFPGNLERAVQHSYAWEEAGAAASRHRAFLRVLSTYAIGAAESDPVAPADYEALPELDMVTSVAHWLMTLPGALAYFNPGGEMLHSPASLNEAMEHARAHGFAPLDVWTNVRMFDAGDGWTLMDTVGMQQLDLLDHEAAFQRGTVDGSEVANFLRNLTLYTTRNGEIIEDGDTIDGPGGKWRARRMQEAVVSPPRSTVYWSPEGAPPAPAGLPR